MDYLEVDTLLTFGPTVSTISVPITIINDLVDEPQQEFEADLELITVSNVVIAPSIATVIIEDDDGEWLHILIASACCIIGMLVCT